MKNLLMALGLCAPLCALGQGLAVHIPYFNSGTDVVAWSAGTYQAGAMVTRNGQLCMSIAFNNADDPASSTKWACSSLVLTTTGTSGPATYSGGVLNIPQYSASGTTNYAALTNTPAPAARYIALGDSIACGFLAPNPAPTAPFNMYEDCQKPNGFPYLIGAMTGVAAQDYGIPGDQACDVWPRQIGTQAVSPSLAAPLTSTVLIGTNDANLKGTGAYEATFNACEQSFLAWMAIPLEYKVLPPQATSNSGWSLNSGFGSYGYAASAGSTITYTITTYGGPIFLWHGYTDGVSGQTAYSIDSGSITGSFATAPTTAQSTQNGTTNSIAATVVGIAAGTHTVTLTLSSGQASTYGVGTPPPSGMFGAPVVAVGSVPLPENGQSAYASGTPFYTAMTQYTADTLANVTALQGYGLNIRYVDDHPYYNGSTNLYTDVFHPSAGYAGGAGALASAFLSVLPMPQISTRVASFTSTSGGSTGYAVSGGTTVGSNPGGDTGNITSTGGSTFAIPITASGSLAEMQVGVYDLSSGGTFTVYIMSCSGCSGVTTGGTMTVVSSFTITPSSTGEQTFFAGHDFSAVTVSSGQYIGLYPNGAHVGYVQAAPGYLYYNGAAPTTGVTFTGSNSGSGAYSADFSANVGGTVTNTGSATSTDVVSILGMTAAGHCAAPAPTNASAASATPLAYVSGKSSGSVTVTHVNTAGMTYDLTCTAF